MNEFALMMADLAFINSQDPTSERVRAAVHAYEWVAHHHEPNFSPSLNDWREFARSEGIKVAP